MSEQAETPVVGDFPVTWPVSTRWTDNDMFGHLNNAVHYGLFDSAINAWLAREAGQDAMTDPAIPYLAESGCRYLAELRYPQDLVVGIRVDRLGTSSVTFALALYPAGAASTDPVAAVGRWVHVYVDRETRRPTPVPDGARAVYESAR